MLHSCSYIYLQNPLLTFSYFLTCYSICWLLRFICYVLSWVYYQYTPWRTYRDGRSNFVWQCDREDTWCQWHWPHTVSADRTSRRRVHTVHRREARGRNWGTRHMWVDPSPPGLVLSRRPKRRHQKHHHHQLSSHIAQYPITWRLSSLQRTTDNWLLCIRGSPLACTLMPGVMPGKVIGIPSIKLSLQCKLSLFDAYLIILQMGWLWYVVTCRWQIDRYFKIHFGLWKSTT